MRRYLTSNFVKRQDRFFVTGDGKTGSKRVARLG